VDKLPFGIKEEAIKTIGIDSSSTMITNNWEEVKRE